MTISITEALDAYVATQVKIFACHTNRASSIGHECVRMLTYARTNWKDQRKPTLEMQKRFNMGNMVETYMTQLMTSAGIKIIRQQEPLENKEHQITGHPDGSVVDKDTDEDFPFDIKSSAPSVYSQINGMEDFKRYSWTKKYISQLMVYMHEQQKKKGLFIFVDKSSGAYKVIWIDYDPELIAEIFAKADEVNANVKNGTQSERIEYGEECSKYCPYLELCLPDVKYEVPEFVVDEDMIMLVKRYNELRATAKEFKEVEDELKKERIKPCLKPGTVGEKKTMFIGDTEIKLSWLAKKAFEVKASSYWVIKIGGGDE